MTEANVIELEKNAAGQIVVSILHEDEVVDQAAFASPTDALRWAGEWLPSLVA